MRKIRRRLVRSGAVAAFNPLTDPDLLYIGDPADATDNGTTLSVPVFRELPPRSSAAA